MTRPLSITTSYPEAAAVETAGQKHTARTPISLKMPLTIFSPSSSCQLNRAGYEASPVLMIMAA